ncbi:MAG: exodeoxyribonuclease III [Cyclobacteriaceae bacterium]|nr:exodeoxyribonuclease III [Cyclobacteriaceae bacterium]
MNIISYNVNGIRAAIKKGLIEWITEESPDIVCFQEVKALAGQVDLSPFEALGYKIYWHPAQKKGYSGVAVFSKTEPLHVAYGSGMEEYDQEGRFIRADFEGFSLLNVYIPSGTSGEERQNYKMKWLDDFGNYVDELNKKFPKLIICGDFNIANHPIDIHNPVGNKKSSGFLPEEREWLTNFFSNGFFDVYRHFHSEPHQYTWWTYRANARQNNKGWRIDYFAASNNLKEKLEGADILQDAIHSDHCPVKISINNA